jgi:hypothetical protein
MPNPKLRFTRGSNYTNAPVRQRGELSKTYEQLKAEEIDKYGLKIDNRNTKYYTTETSTRQ